MVPIETAPAKVDVAVVVDRSEPTVNCDVVAMSESPSDADVMIELFGYEVTFVPP